MRKIKQNAHVQVHYRGFLEHGLEFDTTFGKDPFSFMLDHQMAIPGFEKAVQEMEPGERKTVHLSAEQAFGSYNQELLTEIEIARFPSYIKPVIGMMLEVRSEQGKVIPAIVQEVKNDSLILDGNHPLAGKQVSFEIELLCVFD